MRLGIWREVVVDDGTSNRLTAVQRWLHEIEINDFPHVKRWYEAIKARPPVQKAMALLKDQEVIGNPSDETRDIFFGKSQMGQNK